MAGPPHKLVEAASTALAVPVSSVLVHPVANDVTDRLLKFVILLARSGTSRKPVTQFSSVAMALVRLVFVHLARCDAPSTPSNVVSQLATGGITTSLVSRVSSVTKDTASSVLVLPEPSDATAKARWKLVALTAVAIACQQTVPAVSTVLVALVRFVAANPAQLAATEMVSKLVRVTAKAL